jgi:hypothetical protein
LKRTAGLSSPKVIYFVGRGKLDFILRGISEK